MNFLKPFLVFASLFVSGISQAELIGIDNDRLLSLMDSGVPVIDVRRADEWEALGVIEGSHKMTFFDKAGRYDAQLWFEQLKATVDTGKPVVLICHSGVRTSIIGKWLGTQLNSVYHVEEGIEKWIDEKRPVVRQ